MKLSNVSEFDGLFESCMAVGSRRTCVPPPTDTDDDWIFLVKDGKWEDFIKAAEKMTFKFNVQLGSKDDDGATSHYTHDKDCGQFRSMRRDDLNVIAVDNEDLYRSFLAASYVAKKLNLTNKADRVLLFDAVQYAKGWDLYEETIA